MMVRPLRVLLTVLVLSTRVVPLARADDWVVGNIIGLCRGTEIREGPGFGYRVHTVVPEDNWAVKIVDGPRYADGEEWWDTSRRAAGDPSGGTGWVYRRQAESCRSPTPTPAPAQVVLVVGLSITPPSPGASQWVNARFTVRNMGGQTFAPRYFGVKGRGPGDSNYDFLWMENFTLGPGQEFTYDANRPLGPPGRYCFTPQYSPDGMTWHDIRWPNGNANTLCLTAEGTPTPTPTDTPTATPAPPPPTLTSTPAPPPPPPQTNVLCGQPVTDYYDSGLTTLMYSVLVVCGSGQRLLLTATGFGGSGYYRCEGPTILPLEPPFSLRGGTLYYELRACNRVQAIGGCGECETTPTPTPTGTPTATPARTPPPTAAPRSPSPARLVLTGDLTVSPSRIRPGQGVNARFTVRNVGGQTFTARYFGVKGRGPGGLNADLQWLENFTLGPGQEFTYDANRSLDREGRYEFVPQYSPDGRQWIDLTWPDGRGSQATVEVGTPAPPLPPGTDPCSEAAIRDYLTRKGSPLAGSAAAFVSAGQHYDVDPRFVVAIANAESSLGTNGRCATERHNAWGYGGGWPNCWTFNSWEEAIRQVTMDIGVYYFQRYNQRTIPSFVARPAGTCTTNHCWCVGGCEHWVANTSGAYREMGGDPNAPDLSYHTTCRSGSTSPPPTSQTTCVQVNQNPYPEGECTWYAWERRQDLPKFPGAAGHAKNWAQSAQACGFRVDSQPVVGAIAVFPPGVQEANPEYGHVAYVEAVLNNGWYHVSEHNFGRRGRSERDVPPDPRVRFIHGRTAPQTPESTSPQVLAYRSATIAETERVALDPIRVSPGQAELEMSLAWLGSDLDLIVVDPQGQAVEKGYPGLWIERDSRMIYLSITDPLPGEWQVSVYGREVPEGETTYALTVIGFGGTGPPPEAQTTTSVPWGLMALLLAGGAIVLGAGGGGVILLLRRSGRARDRYVLQVVRGRASHPVIPLGPRRLTLGRATDCSVVLPDPAVSAHHAAITRTPSGYSLTDLGSKNGTWVNRRPVREYLLRPGDVIRIGDTELIFRPAGTQKPFSSPGGSAAPRAGGAAHPGPLLERSGPARPDHPMAPPVAWLLTPTARYPLPATGGEVGRDPRCAIVLDDPTVSARHARLEYRDGVWRVTDLGSTNGTFVNGRRVQQQTLRRGDVIHFGRACGHFWA